MITVEQIRLLEQKVHQAVERIDLLNQENRSLKSKLEHYQTRIAEFEKLIESFKKDQSEIEQGIITALDELNRLEDELDPGTSDALETASDTPEPPVQAVPESSSDDTSEQDISETDEALPETEVEAEAEADNPQSGELDIF